MHRREALALFGGGLAALGAGKAADNVLLGYGVVVGTNLREQDLGPLVNERLEPSPFEVQVGDALLSLAGGELAVDDGRRSRTITIAESSRREATELDEEFDLPGNPATQIFADLSALEAGEVSFDFSDYGAFFDRLDGADVRPFTVEALRGPYFRHVDPGTIRSFAGVSPSDPRALVEALAGAFRGHTSYDIPRYLAGSVEDNVLFGAVDLRDHFESSTSFEALERGETSGMFCYEFTYRSIEALEAVPAHHQTPPTFGGAVMDSRHKHVYTAIGSVYREDGELVVPVTFVDYTHSTLYDDLGLRWLLGEGIDAYDARHRATDVYWY